MLEGTRALDATTYSLDQATIYSSGALFQSRMTVPIKLKRNGPLAVGAVRVIKARTVEIANRFRDLWQPGKDGPDFDPEVQDPEITGKPVRRLVGKTAGKSVGMFCSEKNGCMEPWESMLEEDAYANLEVDRRVTRFMGQPLTLQILKSANPRRWVRYTPDIAVFMGSKLHIVEVKHASQAEAMRERLLFIAELFARYDVVYHVWDETIVRHQPRLRNAWWLLRYNTQDIARAELDVVHDYLEPRQSATLSELCSALGSDRAESLVFAMVLRGFLLANLDKPFSPDMRLEWNRGG